MCLHVGQCRVYGAAGGMSRHQQTRSLNTPAKMLLVRRASLPRARLYAQSTLRSKAFVTAAATSALVKDLARAADRPTGQPWDTLDRWVMFSDLHVSTRTLNTCIDVLRKIKQEAEARQAGILFLGDFWHARGALPVEPLNAILEELKTWHQPTLMLVGNHDQVSVGGLDHALEPLAAACSAIHVVEEPTLYRGALWLPYRKDKSQLTEAIEAAGPVKAVFAHADVMGAMMNESFQAKEGLPPDLFPTHVPTYTGHYHKPHTVAGTHIRYVGSPYQVSRGEAGQQKQLLVLDGNWQMIESIPLDLGPRHFALTSSEPALPKNLRSGDKIRWTLPEPDGADEAQKLTQQLLDQGVEVEVVVPAVQTAPRIAASEDIGAVALLHSYATTVGMSQPALAAALDLLRDIEGQGAQLKHEAAVVQFNQLDLEGYGPFREPCSFPLDSRGFCVVTGLNEDDEGAESNGAGKSALVMAPLWCLTGKSDARTEGGSGRGLTSSEVLHDASKLARVCLQGRVNGQPFLIERTIKAGKKKTTAKKTALRFEYAGEDLTCLEQRLTQAEIDRVLGCDLLVRSVFHGQADITALLEAGDDKFKAELGWVVDLEMWDTCKQQAAQQLKGYMSQLDTVSGQQQLRQLDLSRLQSQVQGAQQRVDHWQANKLQQETALQSAFHTVQEQLKSAIQLCTSKLSQLQQWLSHPQASEQQDILSCQLQEAEQQLTSLRQAAEDKEAEVRRLSQRPISGLDTSFPPFNPGTAGAAGTAHHQLPSSSGTLQPAAGNGQRSFHTASNPNSNLNPYRGSTTGGRRAGARASLHSRAASQTQGTLMHSAQSRRGVSLWQPVSGASTSAAAMTPPAPAVAMPRRLPMQTSNAEVQAAEAGLQQLQQHLMTQQAALGGNRATVQAARDSYREYMSLAEQHAGHPSEAGPNLLCDRCLQSIDEQTFKANAWRLEDEMNKAEALQVKVEHDINNSTAAVQQAAQKLRRIQQEAADQAEAAWQQQLTEHAAAMKLEQQRIQAEQDAHKAVLRKELEAWQAQEADREAAEAAARAQQQALEAERAAAWQAAEAVREAARQEERAARAAVNDGQTLCRTLQAEITQLQQAREAHLRMAQTTLEQSEPVLARLSDQASLDAAPQTNFEFTQTSLEAQMADHQIPQVCHECSSLVRHAESASHDCKLQQQRLEALRQAVNPYSAEASRLTQLRAESQQALEVLQTQQTDLQRQVGMWGEVDRGLGRTGVQSFALEGILGELQELTSRYLKQLSSGTSLSLAASRPSTKTGAAEIERITKSVHVWSEGGLKERSIRQLSGGERRRVALALALGFADLVSGRGRLRCNLIVLDEVLQQLDGEGKVRVSTVLRGLPHSTILVVGQADSHLAQAFDNVDVVVKRNGCATVQKALD